MKKLIISLLSFMLIFLIVGCSDNSLLSDSEKYVPKKAELKDVPVYPGATLYRDYEIVAAENDENNEWRWMYKTTGSANEIVAFFKSELLNMGFEIKNEIIEGGSFILSTTDNAVYIDDISGTADPNTPDRNYSIRINLDEWNSR